MNDFKTAVWSLAVVLLTGSCGLLSTAEPMPAELRQAGEHPASVLFPGNYALMCVLAPYENSSEMLPILLKAAGMKVTPRTNEVYVSEEEFVFVTMQADGSAGVTRSFRHSERTADGLWDDVDFEGRRCFDLAHDRVRVTRTRGFKGDMSSTVSAVDQRVGNALGK